MPPSYPPGPNQRALIEQAVARLKSPILTRMFQKNQPLLQELLVPRSYGLGVEICRFDQPTGGIWVVIEGEVSLTRRSQDVDTLATESRTAGGVFGNDGTGDLSARAETAVTALFLSDQAFGTLCTQAPDVAEAAAFFAELNERRGDVMRALRMAVPFRNVPDTRLAQLIECLDRRAYAPGDVAVHQDADPTGVYVVLDGELRATRRVEDRGGVSAHGAADAPHSPPGAGSFGRMTYKNLLVAVDGGIAAVVLNRPDVRNAIDKAMIDDLHAALDALAARDDVNVLVLSGAGGKAFAAGADIAQLRERKSREALLAINARLFQKLEEFPVPTIAAVTGFCLGGGCELAMSCDIRIAGRLSKFGQPEVALGIIPAAGGPQRLPRLVGLGRAKEIIFTGRMVDADEAGRIGLVNHVVDDDLVMERTQEMARQIAAQGRMALRLAKVAMNASSRTGQDTGFLVEQISQAVLFDSADKHERMTAFLEKRTKKA